MKKIVIITGSRMRLDRSRQQCIVYRRQTCSPNVGLDVCLVVLHRCIDGHMNGVLAFLRVVLVNEHRVASDIGTS